MTNNARLNERLRSLPVQLPSDDAERRALLSAGQALAEGPATRVQPEGMRLKRPLAYVAAAMAACIALLMVLRSTPTDHPAAVEELTQGWSQVVGAQQQMLIELTDLFADRLSAVVSSDRGTDLYLSNEAPVRSNQPVFVQVCEKNGRCVRIISFSGRSFQAVCGGKTLELEVLLTGKGQVLVYGKNVFWSSAGNGASGDFRFRAEALSAT